MITDIFPSFILHRRQLPISTLFPYTTLFRSRCADRQPVRRLITSPPMLFRVDEALQQPGLETVAVREVLSHLLLAQAQNPAGKILAAHLRPDEKARHID